MIKVSLSSGEITTALIILRLFSLKQIYLAFACRGNKTFDAIIIEQLWFQCYYALVKHYNFPVLIGFLSVGNLPYVMDSVGKHGGCTILSA